MVRLMNPHTRDMLFQVAVEPCQVAREGGAAACDELDKTLETALW